MADNVDASPPKRSTRTKAHRRADGHEHRRQHPSDKPHYGLHNRDEDDRVAHQGSGSEVEDERSEDREGTGHQKRRLHGNNVNRTNNYVSSQRKNTVNEHRHNKKKMKREADRLANIIGSPSATGATEYHCSQQQQSNFSGNGSPFMGAWDGAHYKAAGTMPEDQNDNTSLISSNRNYGNGGGYDQGSFDGY